MSLNHFEEFATGSNGDWQKRKDAITPRGVAVGNSFYIARAKNAEVWDVEGRRYIDFAGGIAVMNVGHGNPAVVEAVKQQLDCFTHTAYQVLPYPSYVALAERVAAQVPGDFPKRTAFFTTGAEAVENAIKIARASTGRTGVIAFDGAFHGRTSMGMALTGKVLPYKRGFGPFPGEIYHAPYPNALHGVTVEQALAGVRRLFKSDIDPYRVAAMIFEPVQGEGGFYIAPDEFVQGLRAIADEYGILLIADEIQTGFGRTGSYFAAERYSVQVDLITFAKSLAGGLPLSGICGRAEVMNAAEPGGLGGTYAGNPLAVAAAHAVMNVMDSTDLLARSRLLGERLVAELQNLSQSVPAIAEVRGVGSMVAVEFCDREDGAPLADLTKRVQTLALSHGLILLSCGVYGNVLRFLYPLTIEDEVFAEGLRLLTASIQAAAEEAAAGSA